MWQTCLRQRGHFLNQISHKSIHREFLGIDGLDISLTFLSFFMTSRDSESSVVVNVSVCTCVSVSTNHYNKIERCKIRQAPHNMSFNVLFRIIQGTAKTNCTQVCFFARNLFLLCSVTFVNIRTSYRLCSKY